MGADHTAGCAIPGRKGFNHDKEYDVLKPDGQEELSLDLQIMVAILDAMGICFFVGLDTHTLKLLVDLHNARFGGNMTFADLVELGKQTLSTEHRFNLAAGGQVVERLPEFFEIEPLPPHKTVYDVKTASVITEMGNKLDLHS